MIVIGVIDRTGTVLPIAKSAAAGLGVEVNVIEIPRVEELDSVASAVDVLFLGSKEVTAKKVVFLQAWQDANPGSTTVAVVPKGDATAQKIRTLGISNIARGKITVAKAIQRALGRTVEAPEVEAAVPLASTTAGLVFTVASATGGCGKTFFATNLAALIAGVSRRALLVDLDLQFGEVGIGLRVRHPYTIYDGLYDSNHNRLPPEALAEQLDELVYRHELGFDVLTAPKDPVLADYVGASDATHIIETVVKRYDVVVVDTPPSLNEVVIAALDRSDLVMVLATPDIPSLKNLGVFLDTLRRLQIPDNHLRLLLNKVDDDIGLNVKEIYKTFQNRFVGAIPHSRLVSRAVNLGTTAVTLAPRAPVSLRLRETARVILPPELAPPPMSARRGLLSTLLAWFGQKRKPADTPGGAQ